MTSCEVQSQGHVKCVGFTQLKCQFVLLWLVPYPPGFSLEPFDGFDCKDNRKRRGTWELKEGLTVRARDTEWHLTARADSWGQRSPLWWSGWCYSGPDPWKEKKGRGIEKKVKAFHFTYAFNMIFQVSAHSRVSKQNLIQRFPGSASMAPDSHQMPAGQRCSKLESAREH